MKPKKVWWLLKLPFVTWATWRLVAEFELPIAPRKLLWVAVATPDWEMLTVPRVSRSGSSSPVSASSSSMLSSDMMVPFFLLDDPISPFHGYRAAHAAGAVTKLTSRGHELRADIRGVNGGDRPEDKSKTDGQPFLGIELALTQA